MGLAPDLRTKLLIKGNKTVEIAFFLSELSWVDGRGPGGIALSLHLPTLASQAQAFSCLAKLLALKVVVSGMSHSKCIQHVHLKQCNTLKKLVYHVFHNYPPIGSS